MKQLKFFIDNRYSFFKTISVYLTYFSIGCVSALLGSSLLDLQILANTDFAKISLLVTFRSVGHVSGSLIAGIIGSKFKLSLVLAITNFFSGLFIGLVPFLVKFEYMSICILIAGINYGIADILSASSITIIWKDKCANFIQVLFLFGGIGALISPVITRPFLLPSNDEKTSFNMNSSMVNSIDVQSTFSKQNYESADVTVHYAFLICGLIGIIISIPFMYFYLNERKKSLEIQVKRNDQLANANPQQTNDLTWKSYIAVALVAIVGHSAYSLETVVNSLATSFSVKSDLHMDKKSGVLLATVFWSCFSFYRLIFIPLTFIISESKLLATSLTISLTGLLITVPWANNNEICIWIGFTLIGIGISPIFAASFGVLNSYIIITPRIVSIILSITLIGESIHPAIAAFLMTKKMIVFLYYLGALGISYILSLMILIVYCKKALEY
ncbi:major facilitator superfamily domain-containing protein 4A-like [Panonychus citri]|uniref:major facilitator superfamily domain-containing protein 4A-like n=1 Tax=Panonychus citri TaxID=50023 RepID=UPI002307B303|nr:major facilitator superfamily domain-containing protein 4A-like [Panonychus citri]